MGRVLAIDYGTKRVGLAVTDPLQIIATGLTALPEKEVEAFLKKYVPVEGVEHFVVGDPKDLENRPADAAAAAHAFVNKLRQWFPNIPVTRMDERFTSRLAAQSLLLGGATKKQRRDKLLVDEVSATLILQTYLQLHGKRQP